MAQDCGSSPLARGTPSTPAWRALRRTAHPRSRGEHRFKYSASLYFVGSSPLARGTPDTSLFEPTKDRLIPARAGNTEVLQKQPFVTPAHPRSRGEHCLTFLPKGKFCGSSPLARGTRTTANEAEREARLIPARAGNTYHLTMREWFLAAHPRSRGEHVCLMVVTAPTFGSSPLARGTPSRR